jgi:hypothetical protein
VSTRPFHSGDTENDGFYTDEHGIYSYIPGKTPVHAVVITERTVSVGPYTPIHGRTRMFTYEQDLFLLRRYPWSYRDCGINLCTIRIHPCSSIENIRTRMVPVFTRSFRWLHSTSRFIHGTNTVDFCPGRSRRKIKHV